MSNYTNMESVLSAESLKIPQVFLEVFTSDCLEPVQFDPNDTCDICLETYGDGHASGVRHIINCGDCHHIFGTSCLLRLVWGQSETCPLCRTKLSLDEFFSEDSDDDSDGEDDSFFENNEEFFQAENEALRETESQTGRPLQPQFDWASFGTHYDVYDLLVDIATGPCNHHGCLGRRLEDYLLTADRTESVLAWFFYAATVEDMMAWSDEMWEFGNPLI
ncbi:hypothetical protein P280DRAFT_546589 [Massarina eburnea CBS 473.64]|uniref:RING-type domain-containing protein n=1 Tax=Massarina eburnea CBS 473.64 TaxID=1395130 RepID=A0A6A6S9U7_9PLEO|nr:hypothetical protein P280DRAFT_546589 [Massarina eburnea CBS 473.64]